MSESTALSGAGVEISDYEGDGADWNRFALEQPEARFCHLAQYSRVVEEAYAYRPFNLVARRQGRIVAIWPSCLASSLLLGRRIISQPFSEYGGILAGDLRDPELEDLVEAMRTRGSAARATQIEVHGTLGLRESPARSRFEPANPYGCAILKLDPDPERLRREVFEHQVRKALQKAARNGVQGFEDHTPEILRRHFWPLFLRSMKRLGSPPHPLAYFTGLARHYPAELKIFWASVGDRPAAALLGFAIGKRIQITHIASDERHWDLRVSDLVHWEFIKWGCERGFEEFDFGSVRYEGQQRFKKKWGAEIRDGGYYLAPIEPGRRVTTFRSSSDALGTAATIWGKCVPLWLTPLVGPVIRRHLIR